LVAAWSDALEPKQMLSLLEHRFDFPGAPTGEKPERHRSLQAVFDSSYALLVDAERQLLRRLSIFIGGWTLEAAEAICNGGSAETAEPAAQRARQSRLEGAPPAPSMLILLKRLVEKSLVVFRGDPNSGQALARYHLLEMTRQYAQEQLTQHEREETESRHAAFYFQDSLAAEVDVYENETHGQQFRRMMTDSGNYSLALFKWRTIDADKALLMFSAVDNCIGSITMPELYDWVAKLDEQALPAPSAGQARLYFRVAIRASYNTLPAWVAVMEKAYVLAKECGDKLIMANALSTLGSHDLDAGNTESATERLYAALEYAKESGYRFVIASVYNRLISLACSKNDLDSAQTMAEALVQSGRDANHWSTTTTGLSALADVADYRHQYSYARDCIEQALEAFPEAAMLCRTNALRKLGRFAVEMADYVAAQEYFDRSVAVCQESGDLPHEAATYRELALVALRQNDGVRALAYVKQALRIFDLICQPWGMTACLHFIARFSAANLEQALFLWSAYERLGKEGEYSNHPDHRQETASTISLLQTKLSANVVAAIQERCATLSWREILNYAYSDVVTCVTSAVGHGEQ
jgi:tetratricopeptide (TPR) repeat protein